uniref:Tetraspanin-5 n=1 Tax=Oncorhynchus kisutch TaxID=8019 RepID=A0A8C7HKX5_ONCKI
MMSGKYFKAHEVSCCIKYFIFGFNIIFWGVLSNISSITDLGGFDPVWLFLVVGGVMFILGFAGCIGALRENSFLLKFFSVFLGIIFFLELTAGVLAFVFKDWIKDQLNFFINNNIRAYRDDIDLQNLIDFTQEYVRAVIFSQLSFCVIRLIIYWCTQWCIWGYTQVQCLWKVFRILYFFHILTLYRLILK